MTVFLSASSTEYVSVQVTADDDPTGSLVQMAFMEDGTAPSGADWVTAEWYGGTVTAGNRVKATARALVDAGDLTAGDWVTWLRVYAGAEVVTDVSGYLRVF